MNFEEIKHRLSTENNHDFSSLVDIVALLRSDIGCPWDRAQDHHSIRENLIEEAYEVVEGIDNDDPASLREELGDLMLQAVFHARIEEENGAFDMNDVIGDICDKLIRRHPHIFTDSDKLIRRDGEIIYDWDEIKAAEKSGAAAEKVSPYSIPPSLPALMKSDKIQSKHRRLSGKDFASFAQVRREFDIVMSAVESDGDISEEISTAAGDMLRDLSAYLCSRGIKCEKELSDSISRFIDGAEI
jgi:tetrapyrrole methylase family protein/MazG family protein